MCYRRRVSFDGLLVHEIFHSLQGETSHSGLPYAFIRLSGCNLRCTYCDTAYAFKGGRRMSVEEVVAEVLPFGVRHALVTGGEPLMQRQTPRLVEALRAAGFQVSIETHGEASVAAVAGRARLVMDAKTPSSGMCRGGFRENLKHLRTGDEVKFVIASEEDYAWARGVLAELPPQVEALLSPAQPAPGAPGKFPGVSPRWLAERMLADRLHARFQLQLHKAVWGADRRGV
jgi:7-carboxy-7-deazaguanine synthase